MSLKRSYLSPPRFIYTHWVPSSSYDSFSTFISTLRLFTHTIASPFTNICNRDLLSPSKLTNHYYYSPTTPTTIMLPISGNKSEMSLAETYFLATRARSKLSKAASRHDHDLRVLVAHANMLDSVMDSLAEKRRLEKSMLNTAAAEREAANAAVAFDDEDDDEEYFSDSDSDTDSDSDEEEEEEEEFDDSKYRNLTHIPFGSNKREFRALPTVDEDTTDLPLLSYSSDEEEEEEELVEVGVVTATTDESQDDLRKPQTPAVVFRTPQIVAI